jgi:UDP-N-acetylmuramoyl-L-alanyl-D-glutamate--2,6-diaminopimelate ligase
MELVFNQDRFRVTSPLVGLYNGYNILAACAAGFALGIDRSDIVRGIAGLRSVRGRLEKAGPNTFVDFAHTPKALEHVLSTLRLYTRGRIIAVFGCGGDRDKGKRPLMGQAVSRQADFAVVTSDNPRRESPPAIIKDIEAGMAPGRYEVVEDRRDAIARALALRQPDDIVIVCGKGHEEEQIFKDRTIEFDDMKVVQELMRERGGHV